MVEIVSTFGYLMVLTIYIMGIITVLVAVPRNEDVMDVMEDPSDRWKMWCLIVVCAIFWPAVAIWVKIFDDRGQP